MERQFYLDLANQGRRIAIAADLILHERDNPSACRMDGACLGKVLLETAERFRTPLIFPLMDLRVEKEWMLSALGIPADKIDEFHFAELDDDQREILQNAAAFPPTQRMKASLDAISYVAEHRPPELIPLGMCIGPFSLITKLLEDPITSIYQVALDPDDEDAQLVLEMLEYSTRVIVQWITMQCQAGAQAVCVCEPACNTIYISPRQIADYPDLLHELVLQFNQRLKAALLENGADLILHDCGELNETIVRHLASLDPAILSLGSPVSLPEAAAWVPRDTVLMGNLPSKKFYTDSEMTEAEVVSAGQQLLKEMDATGHPFILGTECDVLCVSGCEDTIKKKILALSTL